MIPLQLKLKWVPIPWIAWECARNSNWNKFLLLLKQLPLVCVSSRWNMPALPPLCLYNNENNLYKVQDMFYMLFRTLTNLYIHIRINNRALQLYYIFGICIYCYYFCTQIWPSNLFCFLECFMFWVEKEKNIYVKVRKNKCHGFIFDKKCYLIGSPMSVP